MAAPLIALAGVTVYTINLIRYHEAINVGEVVRLGAAAALGVPMGIWVLGNLQEYVIKVAMWLLPIGYALGSLFVPAMSRMVSQRWVYVARFVIGCLGGASGGLYRGALFHGTGHSSSRHALVRCRQREYRCTPKRRPTSASLPFAEYGR